MLDRSKQQTSGVVLLIALALIILVTFVVVAYFSRTTTNRRIESAASATSRADTIGRGAIQAITADLLAEIGGGSSTTAENPPIYVPNAPQQMIPARVLAQASMTTSPDFNNLVKQSTARFFPATYTVTPLIQAVTNVDTTVGSLNNRSIGVARWRVPLLDSGAGLANADQLPRWILVTRQGIPASQVWDVSYSDRTPGNQNAVIGRFAYNIYDTGGLLDANVAGFPILNGANALSSAQIQSLKSSEAGAYLYDNISNPGQAIIPGFTQQIVTNFVNTWKYAGVNQASVFLNDFMSRTTIPGGSVSYTFAQSGFMRPTLSNPGSPGNVSNTFAHSRQELIRAQSTGQNQQQAYLASASLPYLTHFTRELTAPSWSPTQDASAMGGNNGTAPPGNPPPYAYSTNRDNPAVANRDVRNVRVLSAFTRPDGNQAIVGEPLIKTRFPLRRLDGVGSSGINTGGFPVLAAGALQAPTAATVQRDFGLSWNATQNRWDYVGASATNAVQPRLLTLGEVARGIVLDASGAVVTTVYREPNFFEILKAFILSGSIGLGSGSANTLVAAEERFYITASSPTNPLSADSQIIQIGTNILDQWDGDKNPTFIYFAGSESAGTENLPYINKLLYQPQWSTASAFGAWLLPSFWNSAQNGTAVGSQNATVPAVRFMMTSGAARAVVESGALQGSSNVVMPNTASSPPSPSFQLVPTADFYSNPNTPTSSSSNPAGVTPAAPNGRYGIPFVFSPNGSVTRANITRTYPVLTNATFVMQVQIGGSAGPWKTYQSWTNCNVNVSSVTSMCQPGSAITGNQWGSASIYDPEYVILDPRTMRFGVWESHGSASGDTTDFNRGYNETLDRASNGFQIVTGFGPQGASFTSVGAQMANNTTTAPNYLDLDGVRRQGDSLDSGHTSAIRPTNTTDRPPILSRQIRTIAELGTVFRDQPWKTISFTTSNSADAGLLDAFTIFEANAIFRSDLAAGKLSLNTRQAVEIQSLLRGVATNTSNSTPLLTRTQCAAIADAIVGSTSNQPMVNKSELVTRLSAILQTAAIADPTITGLATKEVREAVIRALGDVGQTRTWNLMIDVIAQTGHYTSTSETGPNANPLANFLVEGEKRYWLHIAIDRFTGEIIDQQLEAIVE